jgi:pilus assembly protein TadC
LARCSAVLRRAGRRAVRGDRAAGIGFIAPDFVVSGKARSRKDRIRAELPDALDLMAVSVEAGMASTARSRS